MSTQFTRKRALSLPVLSFKERDTAYVQFMERIHPSDVRDPEKPDKEPAKVAHVVDLETGEDMMLICPAVVAGTLEDSDQDYVGMCFELWVSPEKKAGKDYKEAKVYEIECPANGE